MIWLECKRITLSLFNGLSREEIVALAYDEYDKTISPIIDIEPIYEIPSGMWDRLSSQEIVKLYSNDEIELWKYNDKLVQLVYQNSSSLGKVVVVKARDYAEYCFGKIKIEKETEAVENE